MEESESHIENWTKDDQIDRIISENIIPDAPTFDLDKIRSEETSETNNKKREESDNAQEASRYCISPAIAINQKNEVPTNTNGKPIVKNR